MDYDYRNRTTAPYNNNNNASHNPSYNRSSSTQPPYGHNSSSSLYPTVGQSSHHHHHHHHPTALTSSGLGIRVFIKPEYRIKPLAQMLPQAGDIRRSVFEFDFQLEKRIMTEVDKDPQNWSRVVSELFQAKPTDVPSSAAGSGIDSIVNNYFEAGLRSEAVELAVANYGDNPTKVSFSISSCKATLRTRI